MNSCRAAGLEWGARTETNGEPNTEKNCRRQRWIRVTWQAAERRRVGETRPNRRSWHAGREWKSPARTGSCNEGNRSRDHAVQTIDGSAQQESTNTRIQNPKREASCGRKIQSGLWRNTAGARRKSRHS
jgi:hypothetical protein